ncbi:hypothetical protein A33Q_3571 [Indibacter alkaliphilus LW1]|uniref:Uncharacterized protein n=1 Tax=Indibacter alkaliphilus (strain CCUG 57479 / KCTC 22604 / LW1) TaxID=1189612 RepID=S2D9G4_INDAL|nr:hypothetical protein [Indibacter alkaliphilus]EOZ93625.1 hypothetical protein A33Q_3571 [Indibacter alkaliphilus LW1]
MKKAVLIIEGILFLMFLFSCCEPKEVLPIEKNSSVSFSLPFGILEENNAEGIWVRLHLSQAAYEVGEVKIKQISRDDFNPFTTIPEMRPEGIISLDVPKGSTEIMFKVIPIDDAILTGHKDFTFQIHSVKGKLLVGSLDFFELKFKDDELEGKLKSYETQGAETLYQQQYEYDNRGNIRRVTWKSGINQPQLGQYIYQYNEAGQLKQIFSEPERLTQIFTYSDGFLSMNERPSFSDDLDFETYAFDEHGRPTAISYKSRKPSGYEELLGYRLFSYYPNGNLETMSYFVFISAHEVELRQKVTYSEYKVNDNPLPFFDGVPGLLIQPKLPGEIIWEEMESSTTYFLDYEFQSNGMVSHRTLRGPMGDEITKYYYY